VSNTLDKDKLLDWLLADAATHQSEAIGLLRDGYVADATVRQCLSDHDGEIVRLIKRHEFDTEEDVQ
jgi:hypothetical protein